MSRLYGLFLALLSAYHLQMAFRAFEWPIPVYVTVLGSAIPVFYLYKKGLFLLQPADSKLDALLYGMQLPIAALQLAGQMSVSAGAVLLAAGTEIVRQYALRQEGRLKAELVQAKEQMAQMNETFKLVRGERHDFLKHISAIHFMLENGKPDEAASYLDGMVEKYEETNLSIKGERGTVAAILHKMYQQARQSGIQPVYDLDIPISSLPLSDHDTVALLGNLLYNSMEACEEWGNERKGVPFLTLQFYKRSGLYVLICQNSCLPVPAKILDELYDTYGHTTKGSGHSGLGTKIIADIVTKHHGFLDFTCTNEQFKVKIKIPAIR